jgi:hypothetical protein
MITKDNVTTAADHRIWAESGGKDGLPSRVGRIGPHDATDRHVVMLRSGDCDKWRCLDDDGNIYYYGNFVGSKEDEQDFAPLWDFCAPDAGAVTIEYKQDGKWVRI